jgi:starvation-inducible DNA-binding protein
MQPTRSVELLAKHLAAAVGLHAQVKQAHWNVRGPSFIAIHELFDKVSTEVENYSDLIAERAGGLGGTAYGKVQVAAERSFLVPYPLGIADEQEHVFAVSATLAAFVQSAREAIDQAATFEMPIPPICSPKSLGASTINYGSSNLTSRQKRAQRRSLGFRLGRAITARK